MQRINSSLTIVCSGMLKIMQKGQTTKALSLEVCILMQGLNQNTYILCSVCFDCVQAVLDGRLSKSSSYTVYIYYVAWV